MASSARSQGGMARTVDSARSPPVSVQGGFPGVHPREPFATLTGGLSAKSVSSAKVPLGACRIAVKYPLGTLRK